MLPRLARVLMRLHQQDERHGEAQHEHISMNTDVA